MKITLRKAAFCKMNFHCKSGWSWGTTASQLGFCKMRPKKPHFAKPLPLADTLKQQPAKIEHSEKKELWTAHLDKYGINRKTIIRITKTTENWKPKRSSLKRNSFKFEI